MAIVPQYLQKDEEKEMETLSPQAPTTNTQPTTSGQTSTASTSGGMSSAPKPTDNTRKTGPGMFNNIRQYVSANAPKTANMGQAVGKQFDTQAAQIGQSVQQKQQAQEQKIASVQTGLQQQQQTATSLFDQANKGEEIDQAEAQQFRQATTPETMDPYGFNSQTARDQYQVKALQDLAKKTNNEDGRFDLLQRTFGNQGYTSGQSRLDQLLLQRSPEAAQNLSSQAQAATQQAQGSLDASRQAVLQQIAGLKPLQDEIKGMNNKVATTQEELRKDLNDRTLQRSNYIDSLANATRLESGVDGGPSSFVPLDVQALQGLNIKAPELYGQAQLLGLDPSQFLSRSASGTATETDLARARALAALAGKEQDIIADPDVLGGGVDRLQLALTQAQQDYQNRLKEATTGKYQEFVDYATPEQLQGIGSNYRTEIEQLLSGLAPGSGIGGSSPSSLGNLNQSQIDGAMNLSMLDNLSGAVNPISDQQTRDSINNAIERIKLNGVVSQEDYNQLQQLTGGALDQFNTGVSGSQQDAINYIRSLGGIGESGPRPSAARSDASLQEYINRVSQATEEIKKQEEIRKQFALRGYTPSEIERALLGRS